MSNTKTTGLDTEYQRIRKLSEFDLDYLELQEELKNLIELAGMIAGTEISVLNLLDHHMQWTLSPAMSQPGPTPREDSVCNITIQSHQPLEINRLDLDARFSDKQYVQGEHGLKYYLGIPLTLKSGENIGVICVADHEEKSTSEEKKKALTLIAKEIVDKLEFNKKLNETTFALTEAVRVKNQIAHDVRGPINGIAGLAEVAEAEDATIEEMKEYFRLIKDSGNGIIDLTDEILGSSKPAKIVNSRYINLPRLKEKLAKLYQLPARSKNIVFQIQSDSGKAHQFFPKRKLLSIFGNLISNAVKFTPSGGEVHIEMDIINTENGKMLLVTVRDTGKGFSKASIQNFYNNDLESSLGAEGEKGFGLGLKLVHEMVHDLEGEMQIASKENEGTKIEVRIPVK